MFRYKLCYIVAQQAICGMSSFCVYKGLKAEWSKWREGNLVDLFSVNDNAVLLHVFLHGFDHAELVLCSGGVLSAG